MLAYVVHFAAPDWCASTVASLLASHNVDIQPIVIHNGGDRPLLPRGVPVLAPGANLGYAGGANLGLRHWLDHVNDDWVCLTSHDVTIPSECIDRLLQIGNSDEEIGILSPSLTNGVKEGGGDVPVDRCWASGSMLLLRRRCVLEVGKFDERYGSYAEDKDYGIAHEGLGGVSLPIRTFTRRTGARQAR